LWFRIDAILLTCYIIIYIYIIYNILYYYIIIYYIFVIILLYFKMVGMKQIYNIIKTRLKLHIFIILNIISHFNYITFYKLLLILLIIYLIFLHLYLFKCEKMRQTLLFIKSIDTTSYLKYRYGYLIMSSFFACRNRITNGKGFSNELKKRNILHDYILIT